MIRYFLFALFLTGMVSAAETPLPIVEETYDAVVVVQECLEDRDWIRTRAYFVRGGKVIAERSVDEQMNWTTDGKGNFLLVWDDYGVCRRVITFSTLANIIQTDESSVSSQDTNPWWWQGRRMTDLKAPEPNKTP